MSIKVKICGITNLEDALVAVEAGADYLGLIFYPPSKRAIDVKTAQCIVSHLRAEPTCPLLVGVFVNETAATMARILDSCNLDLAQLSGDELPSLIGDPHSPLYGRAFKALRPTSLAEAEAEAEWYFPPQLTNQPTNQPTNHLTNQPANQLPHPSLLIDTYHPTLRGGTGETGDWSLSAQLARKIPGLMLAGGLTAENVAVAVRQVRPYAVDVASGVEARPGRKDHGLVKTFITRAREVAD
ncbi:MAG TPA: phosphoribosylanthranilate isomerase [Anaerolineae bacterium]